MADYQRVVESLRDLRQGPLQTVTDEISQLAAEYAKLCSEANDRLRQCSSFLSQGLRTEAIHLAETQPNLLDLVAALDLPDAQAWSDFCQNNGLTVPPPLQLERASALNDAYAQDQPLEHLLAQHRLLALSRGPVRERLSILRKISQIDATNPTWEKDLRVFEAARIKELPSAFYAAVKNRDDGAITALMEEIGKQQWYEPVPGDLLAAVSDAYSRVQRSRVEAQLKGLVEPLREAYAARSLPECQALVQRWRQILMDSGVQQIAPDLSDEIRPVVTFIQEQLKRDEVLKRFKDACRAFAHLLDNNAPDQQLDNVYAKLKEFNEEIPEELTRRYVATKAGRQKTIERSHKVRLATIGSVAAGVIIIILVTIWLLLQSQNAQTAAERINASVNMHTAAGLRKAQAYVKHLRESNSGLLSQSVVTAAVGRMQSQETEFTRDEDALKSLVKQADDVRQQVSGVVNNNSATMAEIAQAGQALQHTLDETGTTSKNLAWADADNRIGTVEAWLRSSLSILKDRVSTAAQRELDAIGAKLDTIPIEASTTAGSADARAQVAQLTERVNTLADLPLLDPDMRTAITGMGQKVALRRSGAEASRTVAEELDALRLRADSAASLQTGLESFIRRFPDDPRTKDFTAAVNRIPLALALEEWKGFVASLDNHPEANNGNAQKRLDALTAYLTAHPDSPVAGTAAQYAAYLKQAAQATAEHSTWQTAFLDLAATPLLTDLGIMEVSDGRKYYTLGEVNRMERKINTQVSVTFQALDPKDLTKRVQIEVDPPLSVSTKPVPAPHAKVMTELLDKIKLLNEENWETFGIDTADKIARNEQMDIVVKGLLLLQVLKTQTEVTGWGVGDIYAKPIALLARQQLDQLPWQDPSRISEGTRSAIRQAVTELPSPTSVKAKLSSGKQALFKSLAFESLGTGVLLKDDNGTWHVNSRVPVANGCMVWTVVPPAAGTAAPAATGPTAPPVAVNPGSLQLVGTANNGQYELNDNALRGIPQGSIVFITRP